MISIQRFVFNTFQVNTYLLFDETRECVIVDAACYEEDEKQQVSDFLKENNLRLVRNINTHCHIDHVLGNDFIAQTYNVYPEYHKSAVPFFYTASEIAASFGYTLGEHPAPKAYFEEGDEIRFGNSSLKVLYTPGHADGHVCFYCAEENFVITGDVLFRDTIGRTDLPSGNFDLLMKSIREKLFTLPPETDVYPGHGPETTINYEMENNPFIR